MAGNSDDRSQLAGDSVTVPGGEIASSTRTILTTMPEVREAAGAGEFGPIA